MPRSFRRILHPTDFSPASRAAFTRAVDLARDNGAELTVAHVIAPVIPVVGDGYISPAAFDQLQASARAWARKRLDALVARAKTRKVTVRPLLLEGVPHEQIVRTARRKRADLIVVGTHGRTGVSRLLLGSVAGRVVATATCPVLTIRGR